MINKLLKKASERRGSVTSANRHGVIWTNQVPELSKYSVGDWTYGVPCVRDWNQAATLIVGKYCSFADGVIILLGGEHRTDRLTTYPFSELMSTPVSAPPIGATKGDVTIGHDVWIGMEAMILSGVTIGSGAIVGARSVVTKDVQPYSIVAGNPARHVRFRLPERYIQEMLNIGWWDWPHDVILNRSPMLLSNEVQQFVTLYGSTGATDNQNLREI